MPKLDGAYEPTHIGPRVEIDGDNITILWQGGVTLSTTFKQKKWGDKLLLLLEDNKLKYSYEAQPYAEIKEIYFKKGELTVVKHFPLSGDDTDVMKKTKSSRFGDVTMVTDELLPQIQGTWKSAIAKLTFAGDKLMLDKYGGRKIVGITNAGESGSRIYIRDIDPARDSLGGFHKVYFEGGRLYAAIDVSDGEPMIIEFTRG